MPDTTKAGEDPEIEAIREVNNALMRLADGDARARVIAYVGAKLGLPIRATLSSAPHHVGDQKAPPHEPPSAVDSPVDALDSEGISPVAVKWIKRSQLQISDLSKVYSIGLDEIDLIAAKVPGSNKKERMRSVMLLKGIAAYLASGAARVTHEQVKEACLHYDAYDANNFASYLKSFSADVSGTKESGYSLTPKGLTSATELVKDALTLVTAKK